jgi:hypothetical protein
LRRSRRARKINLAAVIKGTELGLDALRIAVVVGDDVTDLVDESTMLPEVGTTVRASRPS